MAIRRKLADVLLRPTLDALDAALRDLIDEMIDARGLARRAEVDAVAGRIDAFRRELTERRSEIAALRQSVEAMALADDDLMEDEDLAALGFGASPDLDALRADQDRLTARVELGHNTLGALQSQIDQLAGTARAALERAEKALATAGSALATAEAAADGVSGLEDRLGARTEA